MKKSNAIKALLLIVFIVVAVYLVQYSSFSEYLTRDSIRNFVNDFGVWAPIAYILLYAIGICLFAPGTAITAAGAIIFGTLFGFIYTLIAAVLGASGAFWIARFLGKDAVSDLTKGSLNKYQNFLEQEGFSAVFYLRLIFVPFTPMNFGCGLVNIKFKDYFLGTLLGIIPGTFIFTFFFDNISGITSAADILQWQIILSVVLFVASFSIPYWVKKWKRSTKPLNTP